MELIVTPTPLEGVLVIDVRSRRDERGFFVESYHKQHFAEAGITAEFVQDNHSRSTSRVLRGLHYQDMRAPMGKLVRCTLGAIFDVAVDLRAGSPTFARWHATQLTADNMRQMWVPPGFGHGFVVVSDAAEVQYKCTAFYTPSAEGAVAWDDPEIGIDWPVADPILSARDRQAMSLGQYLQNPAFRYGE